MTVIDNSFVDNTQIIDSQFSENSNVITNPVIENNVLMSETFTETNHTLPSSFGEVYVLRAEGEGEGGTFDHNLLDNRDLPNQHPISAITGLEKELSGKQPKGNYLTKAPVESVNGKTGVVKLTASDVGALPNSTVIPSVQGLASETYVNASIVNYAQPKGDYLSKGANISELTNDSKFATEKFVEDKIAEAEFNGGDEPYPTIIAKIGTVNLLASKWVGKDYLYSQVVTVEGVTENSQVDLTPSVEQLVAFYEKDLTLVTENEDGVVTVYAIGQKPENDYTIQVTITEVFR